MSKNESIEALDTRLKSAIRTLYHIQVAVHGYHGPDSNQVLVQEIDKLIPQLSTLSSSSLPGALPDVTQEILDYVDTGKNPDIYTREFVEQVLRSNAYAKGKAEAYSEFRDVLAEEIVKGLGPEMEPLVARAIGKAAPLDDHQVEPATRAASQHLVNGT